MPCAPLISDHLLNSGNFFDLYPFDGGGCFITHDIVGSITDNGIAKAVLHDGALDEWGTLPKLDFSRFERWRTIEKSCWLNRFYFIVPLAKYACTNHDAKTARLVIDTIRHFIASCPPPRDLEEIGAHLKRVYHNRDSIYNSLPREEWEQDETDVEYVWFDFQPASRILHFFYALHFLRDFVAEDDRAVIEQSLRDHARLIMLEEKHFAQLAPGNHQSLRGMCLLYAAAYFQGEPEAEAFLREGLRVTNYHAANDWLDDGVLHEISPSYHIFESWHLRDACLLAEKYGFGLCPGARETLAKAAAFVRSIRQPDGSSMAINDGYSVNLDPFLASFPATPGNGGASAKTAVFPRAGLASYRDENWYLMLDASAFPGQFSHYHGGKNSLILWRDGLPFFADCGCCSYDDEMFGAYKSSASHGSLLLDGGGDSVLEGTYKWNAWAAPECETWREENDGFAISSRLTSNAPTWKGVEWERNILVEKSGGIRVCDRLHGQEMKKTTFLFSLHPEVSATACADGFVLKNGEGGLKITCETGAACSLKPARSFHGFSHRETILLAFDSSGLDETVFRITPA